MAELLGGRLRQDAPDDEELWDEASTWRTGHSSGSDWLGTPRTQAQVAIVESRKEMRQQLEGSSSDDDSPRDQGRHRAGAAPGRLCARTLFLRRAKRTSLGDVSTTALYKRPARVRSIPGRICTESYADCVKGCAGYAA